MKKPIYLLAVLVLLGGISFALSRSSWLKGSVPGFSSVSTVTFTLTNTFGEGISGASFGNFVFSGGSNNSILDFTELGSGVYELQVYSDSYTVVASPKGYISSEISVDVSTTDTARVALEHEHSYIVFLMDEARTPLENLTNVVVRAGTLRPVTCRGPYNGRTDVYGCLVPLISTDTSFKVIADGYEPYEGQFEEDRTDASDNWTKGYATLVPSAVPPSSLDTDSDGLNDRLEVNLGTNPTLTDTDSDGLSDAEEVNTYYTDPLEYDTDLDGVLDGLEVATGFDPLDGSDHDGLDSLDTDGDRLTDDEELALGTDPNLFDTDGDTYSDSSELIMGTDPLDASSFPEPRGPGLTPEDSDEDGLSDYQELILYGTDPELADTDGGGMDDGEEVSVENDPLDASDDEVASIDPGSLSPSYVCEDPFTDVTEPWAIDVVCRVFQLGAINGRSEYKFEPNDEITRAEWVKVLDLIFGHSVDEADVLSTDFVDVNSGDWFYDYILIAEEEDVIRTRDAGNEFRPNEPITRADAVLWTIRMAGLTNYDYDIEDIFSDVDNDDYFAYALATANETLIDFPRTESNGTVTTVEDAPIVVGYGDGTFQPYSFITRAEAMAIALRSAIAWGVGSSD